MSPASSPASVLVHVCVSTFTVVLQVNLLYLSLLSPFLYTYLPVRSLPFSPRLCELTHFCYC